VHAGFEGPLLSHLMQDLTNTRARCAVDGEGRQTRLVLIYIPAMEESLFE